MENLENIIESLLFVSEDPVTVDALKEVIREADVREIRAALSCLAQAYEERGGGFYLSEVAGGYQLRSRPEYAEWIRRLVQPNAPRLSKAALETLAIIAYKQPVIRSDVEHIRGVDSGGVIRMLLERKLIRVLGRKEIPGRPLIYATTKLFLQVFDLKDLKDLPTPKEIEAMSAEARLAELPEEAPDDETEAGPPPEGQTPETDGDEFDDDSWDEVYESSGEAVEPDDPPDDPGDSSESADPEDPEKKSAPDDGNGIKNP